MKIKLKHWFNILIYISIIFLIFALIKADYLKVPVIHNFGYLILSFLFLFIGFMYQALNWHSVLKNNYKITFGDALRSVGLAIFAKYIPGKIMIIIGKTGYINKYYKYPNDALITHSLDNQIIVLWSGLLVGSIGLFVENSFFSWFWVVLLLFLAMTLFIFTNIFHSIFDKISKKIFKKKKINIPKLSFKQVIRVLPVFIFYWTFFTLGFYFFSSSLMPERIPFLTAFSFPLAATLGILFIISPGGLGFREGILTAYLVIFGISTQDATTISISSRLWFLIGEIFIFALAFILEIAKKQKIRK